MQQWKCASSDIWERIKEMGIFCLGKYDNSCRAVIEKMHMNCFLKYRIRNLEK